MNENKLESIMIGLINHNVKKVCVYYQGCGDSGAIEYIKTSRNSDIEFEELRSWDDETGDDLQKYNSELYSLIEEYCQEMLLDDIEDWWNNDGGWGYVNIDVEKGTYVIENNIRVTDYEEFNHIGNLFEKNKK